MRSQSMLDTKERYIEKIPIFRFQAEIFSSEIPNQFCYVGLTRNRSLLQKDKEIDSGSNVLKTIYRAAEMGHRIWSIINTL